jgi:GTPase SAR1 family protein
MGAGAMAGFKKRPLVLISIGMAGTGKTSLVEGICKENQQSFVLNLDPAVLKTPYEADVDIRDTLDYRQVMQAYDLGPNGAIMTSLNLFATKFDEFLDVLENQLSDSVEFVVVDTPGQIEVFSWSASGSIITQTLGAQFPTMLLFVVDTPRCTENVSAFMSNMLYACSIMLKTQLPLLLVFNKIDVAPADTIKSWMTDFFSFQEAVNAQELSSSHPAYMLSTIQSMGLLLEEFYRSLPFVEVSALSLPDVSSLLSRCRDILDNYESAHLPGFQKMHNP